MRGFAIALLFWLIFLPAGGAFAGASDDCMASDPDRSIAGCTAIIANQEQTKANWALAYYNRGLSYRRKGDIDRAIADYSKAITLNPRDADFYTNRGIAYSIKGNVDRAIADYGKAIALKPDYADAFYNRGNAYSIKGKVDRAIADYGKAIALKPDHAAAYYNCGLAYKNRGDRKRALQSFKVAARLYPTGSADQKDALNQVAELQE